MSSIDRRFRHAAGATVALAVCLLAFPSEAPAEISHDLLWGTGPSHCAGIDSFDSERLASLVSGEIRSGADAEPPGHRASGELATSTDDRPCASGDANSEAANNLCFERAGAPASVVPTLVARARALDVTRRVVSAAHSVVGGEATALADASAPKSVPVADVPPLPDRPDPRSSCTIEHPEDCRSLPPLPPTLNVEAPAVPPNPTTEDVDVPARPSADDAPAFGRRRIGPSEGHDSPPDRPPRTASRSG